MGSMAASQFSALGEPWELNRIEETCKRSSWQTPALSMTSPGELKITNPEETVHAVWIQMNQNTTRNSDGFKTKLWVFTTFCVVYSAQMGFSLVKSTFSPSTPRSSKIYQLCSKFLHACLPSPVFSFSRTPVLESIPNALWRHPWILASLLFLCPNCSD